MTAEHAATALTVSSVHTCRTAAQSVGLKEHLDSFGSKRRSQVRLSGGHQQGCCKTTSAVLRRTVHVIIQVNTRPRDAAAISQIVNSCVDLFHRRCLSHLAAVPVLLLVWIIFLRSASNLFRRAAARTWSAASFMEFSSSFPHQLCEKSFAGTN